MTFIARGQGPDGRSSSSPSSMASGRARPATRALRMLRPLVSPEDDRTAMIGHRTRVALERERRCRCRSIKELEFDRAMGRLSDEDWKEMSGRLRVRAARLIRQLDAGVGLSRSDRAGAGRSGSRMTPATPSPQDRRRAREPSTAASSCEPVARRRQPSVSAPRARRPTTATRSSARAAGRSCEAERAAVGWWAGG